MNPVLLVVLAGLLILAVADLLVITLSLLLIVFAGILFGIFLDGIAAWSRKWLPWSRRWSCAIVVLAILLIASCGMWYMGSRVANQVTTLSREVATSGQQFLERFQDYEWVPNQRQLDRMAPDIRQMFPKATSALTAMSWGLTGMIVIFFVGAYLAFNPGPYCRGAVLLVHADRRDQAHQVLQQLRQVLGRWMTGRIFSMSVVGVSTAIGLAMLGVPLPMSLGVLAALLTFIPNFGPIIAAVPQALLAFQVGTNTVLWVLAFNLALQTMESYLLTPLVQKHEISLPPAVTITMQLLLGATIGVIGVMMAAPLTATAMVVLQMLYIEDPDAR